jgi:hypothetical protein
MLETDIYNVLATSSAVVTALAGNSVYLGAIPKGQPDSPALVVRMPSAEYLKAYDGTLNFIQRDVQVDSYDDQYSVAVGNANIVRGILADISGALATTTVRSSQIVHDMDMPYEPGAGGYVFRRMISFSMWYQDNVVGSPWTAGPLPVVGSNAQYLESVQIAATSPTDGQALVYSASSGQWQPGTVIAGGVNFASDETPSGTIDGSNAAFTLAHSPIGGSLQLVKNGLILIPGTAYTLSANSITYLSGYIPQPGDTHVAWYRY